MTRDYAIQLGYQAAMMFAEMDANPFTGHDEVLADAWLEGWRLGRDHIMQG